MVADRRQTPTQKVCPECIKRMENMGLFQSRKSSFDKALHILLSFCDKNKKEFEEWKKKTNLK